MSILGARNANVEDLKELKSPKEGGTKREYEDFLEKVERHVAVMWHGGLDIIHLLNDEAEETDIPKPTDLDEEKAMKWEIRLWENKIVKYGARLATIESDVKALHSLVIGKVSKMTQNCEVF